MNHKNRLVIPKKQICSSTNAFTLIELLVVISIIAVLMGLLLPAVTGAMDAAKKAQAKNDLIGICNAIRSYNTEYGKFPDAGGGSGSDTSITTNSGSVIKILVGKDDTKNPRRVSFLEPAVPKTIGATKVSGASDPDWNYFDPWGSEYQIKYDSDYDNEVDNFYTSNAGPSKIRTTAIARSIGKDRLEGTADKKVKPAEDDVISWQ